MDKIEIVKQFISAKKFVKQHEKRVAEILEDEPNKTIIADGIKLYISENRRYAYSPSIKRLEDAVNKLKHEEVLSGTAKLISTNPVAYAKEYVDHNASVIKDS